MGMFKVLPPPISIRTPAEAAKAIQHLSKRFILAVDTETTGLSLAQDIAIIVSISDGKDRFTIWRDVIPYFKDLLEAPERQLIMHNAKFDMWMLANVGINVYRNSQRSHFRVHDTIVQHALLDDSAEHGLKGLAKDILGIDMIEFQELFGVQLHKRPLSEVLLDPSNEKVVNNYASLDAYATFHLHLAFQQWLSEMPILSPESPYLFMSQYYLYTELPFTRVLWDIERKGFLLDRNRLKSKAPEIEKELVEIKRWFALETREKTVNLDSLPTLSNLFFGKLRKVPRSYTAGGSPQLNEPTLKYWAGQGCEFSKKLLEYRDLKKHLGTYVLGLLRKLTNEGRIHARFNQAVARTGRLSSSDPNLQNQPLYIRDAYVAPFRKKLLARDYKQLEMRVLAHFSGDEGLCQIINSGRDVHSGTAAKMFHESYEDIERANAKKDDPSKPALTKREEQLLKYRKGAKTINFMLMYGGGAKKLAAALGIPVDDAKELITGYFKAFNGVVTYFNTAISTARVTGSCHTYLGRTRWVPGINSSDGEVSSSYERKVKNTPIQGTAADICKMAMIKMYTDPLITNSGICMVSQVHDEVVFEVPENVEHDREVNNRISEIMSLPFGKALRVPLETSGSYGNNWKETK